MKHITIYESIETLKVSNEPTEKEISEREKKELYVYIHKNLKNDCIKITQEGIIFINYVGYIRLSSFSLEILPKIDFNKKDMESERRMLIQMLQKSGIIKVNSSDLGMLNIYKMTLNEILTYCFVKELQKELIKGPYLEYIYYEDNISVLKGKLLIKEQIKNISQKKSKIACGFEEYSIDNKLNRIFKYCINKLIMNIHNNEITKYLRYLMVNLEEVSDIEIIDKGVLDYNFDRLNNRFRTAFILAKMIINGYSSMGSKGKNESFSILFEMNEVFEKYIYYVLKKINEKNTIYYQHKKYKLLVSDKSGRDIFQLIPDIVMEVDDKEKIIIDTKWKYIESKRNRHGVKREDIFQAYAYLSRYKDAKNVILLYPYNESIKKSDESYLESWHIDDNKDKKIKVYAISLINEKETIKELEELLKDNQ